MKFLIGILILCFSMLIIGFNLNELYRYYSNKGLLDGLYLENYNDSGVLQKAYSLDSNSNWVCINVKGMEFKRAIQVCEHEVAHEIFALKCQDNITKCMEIK